MATVGECLNVGGDLSRISQQVRARRAIAQRADGHCLIVERRLSHQRLNLPLARALHKAADVICRLVRALVAG